MSSRGRKSFMMWLGFVISAVAVYFAFRNEDFGEIFAAMKRANWLILVASTPMMLFSILLRAYRWKYFIRSDSSTLREKYNAVTIGFFVTNILPLRLGEFARVIVFAKRAKRSRVEIFATIAVERFFDILAIVILFVVALPHIPLKPFLEMVKGSNGGEPSWFVRIVFDSPNTLLVSSVIAVALGLVGFLLLCHYGRRVWHWALERFNVRHPMILKIVGSLFDGLETLWLSNRVLPALLLSVLLWFSVAFNFWVTLYAFPSGDTTLGHIMGVSGAIFMDSVLCFGVAAPSAPGFFGVWQLATRWAFIPYPDADSAAVSAFAILVFLIQYIETIGLGLECLKSEGMSLADVRKAESEESAANGESA